MRTMLAILVLVPTLAAACSTAKGTDPGPRFDDEQQKVSTCMRHQQSTPGERYTNEALKRTDEVLPLLRYYTANGRKPYCDKAGPSEVDRAWARLYVQLGADQANVAPLLR